MHTFTDIDMSFGIHPNTKDILKTYDVSAAKVALKNLMLTAQGEKLDDFNYGVGIQQLQFELMTPLLAAFTKRKIIEQADHYIPEVKMEDISIAVSQNSIEIFMSFYVQGNPQAQKFNLVLERQR